MQQLERLSLDTYAEAVLPYTHEMWGAGRTFERYVADLRTTVESRYGTRRFSLYGLRSSGKIVASLKRYDRDARWHGSSLRSAGIGAVFVIPEERGKGRSGELLRSFLDEERRRGTDFAYLFSDIDPALYERLGFHPLPSRVYTVRMSSLSEGSHQFEPLEDHHWRGVRSLFDRLERTSTFCLRRTPTTWEWIRLRYRKANPDRIHLCALDGSMLVAYLLAHREIASDTLALDEIGFDPARGAAFVQPLIRHAGRNLHHVSGWLPPTHARAPLPRGSVKRRTAAISMIAPLSKLAARLWRNDQSHLLAADGDPFWDLDHV